jgi:deazaflavin-dependent oxidoreductase (nitroreductase family)
VPTDRSLKAVSALHRAILRVSRGHFGWNLAGMPVLALTTVGRTTGRPRTVLLTSPLEAGNELVIVASRGGDDHHPAWYLNIERNPSVEVRFQGRTNECWQARIASPAERSVLWPRVAAKHAGYARYQAKTRREIPLVLLGPVPAAPWPR